MASEVMAERFAMFQMELGDLSTMDLGKKYVELRSQIEEVSDALKLLNSQKSWMEERLASKMEEDEIPKFSIAGKNINIGEELNISAKEEGGVADAVMKIVEDNGGGSLIKRVIHAQTLKKLIKSLLEKQRMAEAPDPQLRAMMNAGLTMKVRKIAKFY